MTSVHNTTQNGSDNLVSYLQTNIIAQTMSIRGERGMHIKSLRSIYNTDECSSMVWQKTEQFVNWEITWWDHYEHQTHHNQDTTRDKKN